MTREVELGCSLAAVQRILSLWLCPARQLKQQLRSALAGEQWQGDTALILPLFWRQSTVSPVFFGQYPWSRLHSLALFPPPSPSQICNLASVDVKQHGQVRITCKHSESAWEWRTVLYKQWSSSLVADSLWGCVSVRSVLAALTRDHRVHLFGQSSHSIWTQVRSEATSFVWPASHTTWINDCRLDSVSEQGHMSVTVVARLPLAKSTRVVVFQLPASLVVFSVGSMEMVASLCAVLYRISTSLIYTSHILECIYFVL